MNGLPSDCRNPVIEVYYEKGEVPFVCGVMGRITGWAIKEIEKDLVNYPYDVFNKGNGSYVFIAKYTNVEMLDRSYKWEFMFIKFKGD